MTKQQKHLTGRKYKRNPLARPKYYPNRRYYYSWAAFYIPFIWGVRSPVWTVALIGLATGLLPSLYLLNAVSTVQYSSSTILMLLIFQQLISMLTRVWSGLHFKQFVVNPQKQGTLFWLRLHLMTEKAYVVESFWAQRGAVLYVIRTVTLALLYFMLLSAYPGNSAWLAVAIIMFWAVIGYMSMRYVSAAEDKEKELNDEINYDPRRLSHFKYTGGQFVLANKVIIPGLGFGTYKITDPDETYESVSTALTRGYRLIDTASFYKNEEAIGRAIADSGISRECLFVTSKIWNDEQGYVATIAAFEESLARLGLDYLDLLLVHWPVKDTLLETWRALEDLYESGLVKAIGVCNFEIEHLEMLMKKAQYLPAVNQIELHPRFQRSELVDFCQSRRIHIEAWAPLMRGGVMEIPEIIEIAKAHDKTPAQVALQWAYQKGYTVLPKSVTRERIIENYAGVACFELSAEEMNTIDALDTGTRIGPDPATFSWNWPESSR